MAEGAYAIYHNLSHHVSNAAELAYHVESISMVFEIWIGLGEAIEETYKALPYYDLTPAHYEIDPDYCTCREHLVMHQPCQKIADTLIKHSRKIL